MISRLPTHPATSGLKIHLWVLAVLTISCTVILAGLSTRSWYVELKQSRIHANVIADFARYLETGTRISAERGPANSYMAAPDGVRANYRTDWEAAAAETDALLDQIGPHVPPELIEKVHDQLANARRLVAMAGERPRLSRRYEDIQAGIDAMFKVHDHFEAVLRWRMAVALEAEPDLIDVLFKGMMLADLREQAGRLGSFVIPPLVTGEPIRSRHVIESQQVRGRLLATWMLMEPLAASLAPDSELGQLLDRTRQDFFIKGLALRDQQLGLDATETRPVIDAITFTRAYVASMRPLQQLRAGLMEDIRLTYLQREQAAWTGMVQSMALMLAIVLLVAGLVLAMQHYIFNPLLDASRAIIALAFDQPPLPTRPRRHVAEIRLVHSALAIVADKLTERRRMTEELHLLATTDGLTGLLNRRTIDDIGHRLAEGARSSDVPHLILADIDHFKAINDCFGHPVGDDVLREIGAVLRRTLRSQDHVARYGGEEFAVLLVGQTKAQAACVARKLRKAIKALELESPDGYAIRLTASFGISGGADADWETIVRRADQALYAAKEAGRDRIRIG
ncbi:GGDEF domain-containing protein [Pannonibacter carbonis]|uniref:GGDEF domain-containing protein n=1 Tax=Pannonibacter carbonis TaxID=2067569 RepID=UPI001300BDA4|nr:GGDEF domain-containing protein [Pannonibacter carbonis]